jgi:hypothetical protein
VVADAVKKPGILGLAQGRGILFRNHRVGGEAFEQIAANQSLAAEVRHRDGAAVFFGEDLGGDLGLNRAADTRGAANGFDGDFQFQLIRGRHIAGNSWCGAPTHFARPRADNERRGADLSLWRNAANERTEENASSGKNLIHAINRIWDDDLKKPKVA